MAATPRVGAAVFPPGTTLAAQIRATRESPTVLATLATGVTDPAALAAGVGGLVVVDDRTLEVVVGKAATEAMEPGLIELDFVRTDTAPDEHLFVSLSVPVMASITRGLPQ